MMNELSRSKTLRDCPHLSSLNLSLCMDSYDIQSVENYLIKNAGWGVHCDSSLVWFYDSVNEEYVCQDKETFKSEWERRGKEPSVLIIQHLNNIRRKECA